MLLFDYDLYVYGFMLHSESRHSIHFIGVDVFIFFSFLSSFVYFDFFFFFLGNCFFFLSFSVSISRSKLFILQCYDLLTLLTGTFFFWLLLVSVVVCCWRWIWQAGHRLGRPLLLIPSIVFVFIYFPSEHLLLNGRARISTEHNTNSISHTCCFYATTNWTKRNRNKNRRRKKKQLAHIYTN